MDISTEKIAEMVKRALLEMNGTTNTAKVNKGGIPIGISNRHIHLSQADLETLANKSADISAAIELMLDGKTEEAMNKYSR
mgnify:CR=1 FL=1